MSKTLNLLVGVFWSVWPERNAGKDARRARHLHSGVTVRESPGFILQFPLITLPARTSFTAFKALLASLPGSSPFNYPMWINLRYAYFRAQQLASPILHTLSFL